MFRWPLLVIGIVIVIIAQIMKSDHKALPESAEKINVQKALEYVKYDEKRFVEIECEIDTSKVIYGTVVKKPYYTKKPTDRSYRLEDIMLRNEYIGDYLGAVLTAGQVLSGRSILLQTVSKEKDKNEVLMERVLAHINDKIWVLSPLFRKNDLSGRETWLGKYEYKGGFIRFNDLIDTVNDPEIENELSDIIVFANKEFGILIPEDAYVIIDGYGTDFTPKAYFAIEGSENSIFLVANPAVISESLKMIKGILYPSPVTHYPNFLELIGVSSVQRIATIVREEAKSFNKRKEDDIRSTSTVGAVIIIFSLLLFLRKRLLKKRA
jgi:hypothetical protein